MVLCAALLIGGCAATFQEPKLARADDHSVWASYYLLGTVGRTELDVRDYCPSGHASEIETGADLLTLAVSVVTIGFYTPRRVWITCAPGRAK
jgi:hypothetical protein